MSKFLYKKNNISTETLSKFIKVEDLPVILWEISQFIGLHRTLKFFDKAKGKKVFVPTQYSGKIAILQYVSDYEAKLLIKEIPGISVDLRAKNVSLERVFARAFRRYVQKQYRQQLAEFRSRFKDEFHMSNNNFYRLIPHEQEELDMPNWDKLLDSI